MKIEEYQNMYENDSNHWWFLGLGAIILGLLDKFLGDKKDLKVLDAGCGTCWLTNKLSKYGEVFAVDLEDFALNICRKRGIKNVIKADIKNIPLPTGHFDLIVCSEVLYHLYVKDDLVVMKEFYRILKTNGLALKIFGKSLLSARMVMLVFILLFVIASYFFI